MSLFNSPPQPRRSRSSPRSQHYTTPSAGLEPLEPRQLLSVDLSASFTLIPPTAPSGSRQSFTLSFQNNGDTTARGGIRFDAYAVPEGESFDPATNILLGRFTRTGQLAPGTAAPFTFTTTLSVSLAAGDYRIVAVVDPDNQIIESNETNNLAQSAPFIITQPDYDLVPTFGANSSFPARVAAGVGVNGTVQLFLTNPATSTATISTNVRIELQVFARPLGGGPDVLLNRSIIRPVIGRFAPGQSRNFAIPIHFPAELPLGNYQLVARIDTTDALAESNEANNELPGTVITVVSGPGGPTPPSTGSGNPPPVNLNPPDPGDTSSSAGQSNGSGLGNTPTGTTNPPSGVGIPPTGSVGTTPTSTGGFPFNNSTGITPVGSVGQTPTGGTGNPLISPIFTTIGAIGLGPVFR